MNTFDINLLSSAERFVIWSLRLGLSPQVCPDKARTALIKGFREAGVADALPYFMEMTQLLAELWHEMQRVPDIHCTCCTAIGDDELGLLQTIAALQFRDVELAATWLNNVLPSRGVRIVLHRAMYVAAVLGAAGLTLRCANREAANAARLTPDHRPSLH